MNQSTLPGRPARVLSCRNFLTFFLVGLALLATSASFAQETPCSSLSVEFELSTAISCFNGADGVITATASGGTAPYQYTWDTGETGSTLSDVSHGLYSITVIDAEQCLTTAGFFAAEPGPSEVEVTTVATTCGESTGTISVEVLSDDGPHQFGLNSAPLQAQTTFTGLAEGVYSVQVENGNGCQTTVYGSVNDASSEAVETTTTAQNGCFGDCDAAINAVQEGTAPGDYQWFQVDPDGNHVLLSQGLAQANDLCAGAYFAVVEGQGSGGQETLTFWEEDFGVGCNQGQEANGFLSDNGQWAVVSTGANEEFANSFYVSATEQIGADNCGIPCGGNNDRSLHVSNTAITFGGIPILPADGGGVYLADATTNVRCESPAIDCSGYSNIELTFDYIEFGQGAIDNATLWYYDGTDWTQLDDPAKTECCGGPCNGMNQGNFTEYAITLPASANNNPNVRLGFHWTNNNDGVGSDPSFAVDNLALTGDTDSGTQTCNAYSEVVEIAEPDAIKLVLLKFGQVTCNGENNAAIQVQASGGSTPYTYVWSDGTESSQISNIGPGEYTVTVTDDNGCSISESYVIGPEPEPEVASFDLAEDGSTILLTNTSTPGDVVWDFGDGTTSDEQNPSHTYTEDGEYEVCLTLFGLCGEQTTCQTVTIITVGLNDNQQAPLISVYPNPASNFVVFDMQFSESAAVSCIDESGRVVAEAEVQGRWQIDVADWAAGVYLYSVSPLNSNQTHRGRFVVGE